MSFGKSFSKAPRVMLLLSLVVSLALLALACAPAEKPTAAPTQAAPAVAAPTAAPRATEAPVAAQATTEGKYVERAGLRIFIPQGNLFGGPIIPPDPRPPRYGGIAIQAQPGDPPSLDPYHTTSYLADYAAATTFDRLIHYSFKAGTNTFNNPVVPGLAESWEVSDDLLKYTFHLRKGVKFHNLPPVNGRELDAEDVKATLELYTASASVAKPYYDKVDRVEVVDRYTVVLHMKQVDLTLLNTLTEAIRGSILPREQTDPASLVRRPGGIGTGPFMKVGDYEYKIGITFRRNPDYWLFDDGNRLPYLDGRRIVVIPDNSAATTAFRTGKVDFGANVQPAGGLAGVKAFMSARPTTLVQERLIGSANCVCFRLDKEPWSDVRVRRALSLAIDYEAFSQTINGIPALNTSTLINGFWHGSDEKLTTVTEVCGCPWYTYDPQKAKALLAEAGFPKGFSTTLAFFPYTQSTIESVELDAAYWKAIGVDAKLLSQDYTVYRANVDRGGWENLGYSFTCCPNPPTTIYGVMEALILGGGRNPQQGFINDPKMTALAKEVTASYKDETKQRELVRQARAYFLDQVFMIPTVGGFSYGMISPRLRNFQPSIKHPSPSSGPLGIVYAWIDDDWAFNK